MKGIIQSLLDIVQGGPRFLHEAQSMAPEAGMACWIPAGFLCVVTREPVVCEGRA